MAEYWKLNAEDLGTNTDLIQKLYIAFYGRPADPGGLLHWAQQLPAGANLTDDATKELIGRFVDSPEAQSRFGSPSIEATVDRIYSQAFGRDATETEKASFAGKTVVDVLVSVLGVSSGRDAEALSNKLDYANLFVETLDPNGNFEPDEAPGGGFAATFVGNHDANAIAAKMLFITADTPATESAVVNDVKYIANDGDPILSEPPPAFTLTASAAAVNEGSSVTFSIANGDADTEYIIRLSGVQDADIDGGLFRTVTTNEAGNASIAVNVVADHTTEGPETLTASVVGKALTASVVINDISLDNVAPVTAAVEAPAAQEGGPPVTGQLLATDPNVGDTLTYTVEALPGLTVNPTTGIFTFDPTENGEVNALTYNSDPWVKTVNYTVTDSGGLASTNSLTLTATPVPLTFTFSADKTSAEEGAITVYTVTASEALASAQEVTFTLIPGNGLGANAGTDNTNMADFTGVGVFNPKTVTIAAGEKTATFDVVALTDGINELPEKYSVSAEINGYGTFTLDGTVVDAVGGGQTFTLTAGNDVAPYFIGTANSDEFYAPLSQNAFAGGVSNTLSSADSLDGGGGTDHLYAELVPEFFGATGDNQVDVEAITVRIENVEFEARDLNQAQSETGNVITVDAKKMLGVERIGSAYSDGDLVIENLTTLANDGVTMRNTDAITITMDHTDNDNTDGDASDLKVLFDDDYLLSGQTREAQAFFFLLDEDADLVSNPRRLDRINVDGIRFSLDGGATTIVLRDPQAQLAGTHEGFVNTLQDELRALIDSGKVPAGTTLKLDQTITDTTFLDDGTLSRPIPAIVLTIGDGTPVTPIGYAQVAEAIGEYDVYGRFSAEAEVADDPITSNIELHKVGRGGEGGELKVGGKSGDKGVEVFNVTVLGDDSKPSNLAALTSTGNDLQTVKVVTDPAQTGSYADLTIGNGNTGGTLGTLTGNAGALKDVQTFDATGFKGDLTLYAALTGDVVGKYLNIWDDAPALAPADNQVFKYDGGSGNDAINLAISSDNLAWESGTTTREDFNLKVNGNGGNDKIVVSVQTKDDVLAPGVVDEAAAPWYQNSKLNANLSVDGGAGNDTIAVLGSGDYVVKGATGNDAIYVGSSAARGDDPTSFDISPLTDTRWVFNTADQTMPNTIVTARNTDNLLSDTNDTYAGVYKAKLTVAYDRDLIDTVDGYTSHQVVVSSNANFSTTDLDINQAIKAAINDDPVLSKLLDAYDGPGNTLVVDSIIDGGAVTGRDLTISLTAPKVSELTMADVTAYNARYGGVTTTAELAAAIAARITTADIGNNDYASALANDEGFVMGGSTETHVADNHIFAGAGNDVIVLGMTVNDKPVKLTDAAGRVLDVDLRSSNDTLVFDQPVGLMSNGADTVVNFSDAGNGIDYLDFRYYSPLAVAQNGTALVGTVPTAAGKHYIDLVETGANTGVYKIEYHETGATIAATDDVVTVIGTIDFGQTVDLAAANIV